MSSSFGSLAGRGLHPVVEQAIRRMQQQMREQDAEIRKLKSRPSQVVVTPVPVAPSKPATSSPSSNAPSAPTGPVAPASGGVTDAQIRSIRSQLSATGSAPLLMSALQGESGQVQPSKFPYVTSLPDPSSSPLSQDGAVILVGATVPLAVAYRFNSLTNQWVLIPPGSAVPVGGNERVYLSNLTTILFNGAAATDGLLHQNPNLLPADMNVAGKLMRVHGSGQWATQAAQTPTLTFKLGVNRGVGTPHIFVTLGPSPALTAGRVGYWRLDSDMVLDGGGASSTVLGSATLTLDTTGVGATAIATILLSGIGGALDATVSNSLDFTVSMSTQAVGPFNSVDQRLSIIELLN